MFDGVFADLASGFAAVTGAPYIDAVAAWPGVAVRDDGGSIIQPGVPDRHDCKVQFDSATEAMRRAEGFVETDARMIVLSFDRVLDGQAKIEVATGPRAGTWSVLSCDPDSALIGYVCRGAQEMKGRDKHLRRLRTLKGVQRIAGAVVYKGADDIRAEAFRSISAGSVSGKGHVPSAPGEPPNREFGDLQRNMEAVQTGPVTAEYRSKAGHAAPLEFGTSKMAARPYARPARDKLKPKIEKDFADAFNKFVKASG